jgi:nuclear protein localization family protein 4
MLLRFRGRDGQFRLDVNPDDSFPSLTSRIAEHLPKDVDLASITVSNQPQGGDARRPADLKGVSLGRVGLKLVLVLCLLLNYSNFLYLLGMAISYT